MEKLVQVWNFLGLAIGFEVAGTLYLKASKGFEKNRGRDSRNRILYGMFLVICASIEGLTCMRALCDLGKVWYSQGRDFEFFHVQAKPECYANRLYWLDFYGCRRITRYDLPLQSTLSSRMRASMNIHESRRINLCITLCR